MIFNLLVELFITAPLRSGRCSEAAFRRYVSGEAAATLATMTPDEVQKAIFQAIRAIPRGRVAAYGEVANKAGLPGRARLVGRMLRESPPSARLPWHRVMRADGRPAFPEGSEARAEQLRRLQAEGVISAGGKVGRKYFAWREDADLDAMLWKPRGP